MESLEVKVGIVVQGVAMGISLTAGQQVSFTVAHWSGASAGNLNAHTATIRYILRR